MCAHVLDALLVEAEYDATAEEGFDFRKVRDDEQALDVLMMVRRDARVVAYMKERMKVTMPVVQQCLDFMANFDTPAAAHAALSTASHVVTLTGSHKPEFTQAEVETASTCSERLLRVSFETSSTEVIPVPMDQALPYIHARRTAIVINKDGISSPTGELSLKDGLITASVAEAMKVVGSRSAKEPVLNLLDPSKIETRMFVVCRTMIGTLPSGKNDLVISDNVKRSLAAYPNLAPAFNRVILAASHFVIKTNERLKLQGGKPLEALHTVIGIEISKMKPETVKVLADNLNTLAGANIFPASMKTKKELDEKEILTTDFSKVDLKQLIPTAEEALALQRALCGNGDVLQNPLKGGMPAGADYLSNAEIEHGFINMHIKPKGEVLIFGMKEARATALFPNNVVHNVMPKMLGEIDERAIGASTATDVIFCYRDLISRPSVMTSLRSLKTQYPYKNLYVIDTITSAGMAEALSAGELHHIQRSHKLDFLIEVRGTKIAPSTDATLYRKNAAMLVHWAMLAIATNELRINQVFAAKRGRGLALRELPFCWPQKRHAEITAIGEVDVLSEALQLAGFKEQVPSFAEVERQVAVVERNHHEDKKKRKASSGDDSDSGEDPKKAVPAKTSKKQHSKK